MVPRPGRRPPHAIALAVAVGLYALVVVAGPFLHHDPACHVKSRTHCTSCVAGVSMSADGGTDAVQPFGLSAAEQIVRAAAPRPSSTDLVQAHGRSPPA
jgi:hypothetical protein